MASTIPFNGQPQDKPNKKAPMLDAYFEKEGLNFFQKREVPGPDHTVVHLTALPTGKHRLMAAIITDNSVYTVIRCELGKRTPRMGDASFWEYLRRTNAAHAFFKYAVNGDGTLFLDVCLPAADDHFDPAMVRTAMNLIVFHLQDTYEDVLKWLDAPGDAGTGMHV